MSTTLRSSNVITKKVHRCFSCLRDFPKKTKMSYWVGVLDGEFSSSYSCNTCVEVMTLDNEDEYPEGYVHEMLDRGETPEQLLALRKKP